MTGDEVRRAYLSFFKEKGHEIIPGSSLIPHDDPTLLLTSAGMVQFKPYFLGQSMPPSPRLASCQKCFRTTDIESVGDSSHLTFFEMLGNFSIGDYFKEGAIRLALEFVTQRLGLPLERLWITIFHDDDESFDIWHKNGIAEDRILRFGEEDNFWGPAGDYGPCGPCSEIHYDFGPEVGCHRPSCAPNCECGRFSEIWNLVFVQYNQDEEGQRTPLPKCHIDTGMGLERTAAVMQGKTSVYETDLFSPLIKLVSRLSGRKYGTDDNTDNSMRVVAEHGRGIAFLIADGVLPGRGRRSYVLRRLVRRAQYFSETLAHDKPFLVEIAKETIANMGHIYPELKKNRDLILKAIKSEVESFRRTLPVGGGILQRTLIKMREELIDYFPKFEKAFSEALSKKDIIDLSYGVGAAIDHFLRDCRTWDHTLIVGGRNAVEEALKPIKDGLDTMRQAISDYTGMKQNAFSNLKQELQDIFDGIQKDVESVTLKLSGLEIFILSDTYGFPVELTREIAKRQGFSVDMEGFEKEMEKQRERAKARHKFATSVGLDVVLIHASKFEGYKSLRYKTEVIAIYVNNQQVSEVIEGQEAEVHLEETPFYGEKGGQVGDAGFITGDNGKFEVNDTTNPAAKEFRHIGRVVSGTISVGDEVEAEVDAERRLDIARNHTATHLLQFALRQVLGEHVQQRGSLVAPDRLRFDFSHLTAMTEEEIDRVQRIVNDEIRHNLPVYDENIPYKQAVEEGAIALFDEKYGDIVRVLKIGSPAISVELCGGTHVAATGEIGFLQIIAESSIGGGLRRIEAITGRGAENFIRKWLKSMEDAAELLESTADNFVDEIFKLRQELQNLRKKSRALERDLSRRQAETLLEQAEMVNGIKVLSAAVPSSRLETLRDMADIIRDRLGSIVVLLGTIHEGKPVFIVAVTPDLVKKGYHAGEIVKKVAKVVGGGGGGKASLAQGSGKDRDKLNEALQLVRSLI